MSSLVNKHQRVLIFCFLSLIVLGILALFSGSPIYSLHHLGTPWYYILRHIFFGILPGLILGLIAYVLPLNFFKKLSNFFYFFSIFLLILTYVPTFSLRLYGSRRWINLGFLSFQPVEIVKPLLIIFFASFLSKKQRLNRLQKKDAFWQFLVLLSPIVFLIFFQPNMSNVILISATLGGMFFVAGGSLKQLPLALLCAGLLLGMGLILFPYQLSRFMGLFRAEDDPLGKGYQLRQSLIAIGSGGILGKGFMEGVQKYFYLPSPISDTIFPIFAEETGFLGSVFLVILYFLIFYQSILIFKKSDNLFLALLTFGIGFWIFLQASIHLAATLGLIPFTGMPLPLISYGSTSSAAILFGAGLLLKCAKEI